MDGGKRDIVNGGFKTSPKGSMRFRGDIKLPPLSYKPLIRDSTDKHNATTTTFNNESMLHEKSTLASADKQPSYRGSPLYQRDEFDDSLLQSSKQIIAKSKPRKLKKNAVSMQSDMLLSPRGFP